MTASTGEFTAQLLAARLQGRAAMQALAEEHLPLVAAMVRRFSSDLHEKEELYQQGCIGLMKALARFDPAYGTSFSTYAAAMILGEMRSLCRIEAPIHIPRGERELRSRVRQAQRRLMNHLGREPTIQELAATLRVEPAELALAMEQISVFSVETNTGRSIAELLPDQTDWETRLLLRDMIARLPKNDQRLLMLRLRFGQTQAETARALGITQVQVSRREQALKQQLRQAWTEE